MNYDRRRIAELEMHVAAGTDLPTAIAALPQDEAPPNTWSGWMLCILLAATLAAVWLLSR